MNRLITHLLFCMTVVATFAWTANARPEATPATQPAATQPATRPLLVQMFHGAPGHWCQVCAAAAARKAAHERTPGDGEAAIDPAADPANGDLITDLPPR